ANGRQRWQPPVDVWPEEYIQQARERGFLREPKGPATPVPRERLAAFDSLAIEHPVGTRRGFHIRYGAHGGTTGSGTMVGHIATRKGPFVEIKADDGGVRRMRPAYLRTEAAGSLTRAAEPVTRERPEPTPVVVPARTNALPGWPRGLRAEWAAAYVGLSV